MAKKSCYKIKRIFKLLFDIVLVNLITLIIIIFFRLILILLFSTISIRIN